MTWEEFRQWALGRHGLDLGSMQKWDYIIWPSHKTNTGKGHRAEYGLIHQRRLTAWLRGQDLLPAYHSRSNPLTILDWVTAAEPHDDGWLINTGDGIEWQANPDWLKLTEVGFVGLRCGE